MREIWENLLITPTRIPPSLIGRDSPTSVATAISLPTCAIACIEQAVTTETNCAASDLVCQCNPDNASLIQGEATSCILDACGIDEAFRGFSFFIHV